EPEQNAAAFRADLEAAQKLAAKWKIELKSVVFPRNQYCDRYLAICHKLGILAYRGNESSWIYEGRSGAQESGLRRMLRLMDAYINLTGHNCFSASSHEPCKVPSSRFLRPYSPHLRLLEGLRLKRIVNALDFAARNQQAYHLWWHPHNFGRQLPENLAFLEKILAHFAKLHQSEGMESLNMGEWAAPVLLRAPAGASA